MLIGILASDWIAIPAQLSLFLIYFILHYLLNEIIKMIKCIASFCWTREDVQIMCNYISLNYLNKSENLCKHFNLYLTKRHETRY